MKTRRSAMIVAAASALAVSTSFVSASGSAIVAGEMLVAASQGQIQTPTPSTKKSKDPEYLRKILKNRAADIKASSRETSKDPVGINDEENAAAAAVAAAEPQNQQQPAPVAPPAPAPAPVQAPGQAPAPAAAPAIPAQAAPLPASAARLVFENPTNDFGVVHDTGPLVCTFKFTNKGSEKLVINAINTGCGCTAAKMPKQEFAPGEEGTIEITYNPKGSGRQQRAINITSNDGQNPNIQLTIAAQVIPLFEARPTNIQFGQVSIGEARTVQLVVVSRDKNMKVTSVESNGPDVQAKMVPEGKPQVLVEAELPGVAVIDVTLTNDAPVGRVMRQITVKAMISKKEGETPIEQEIKVFAFGQVQGELTLNPQQIRVAPTAPGTDFEREVIVTRRGNTDFKIMAAEVQNSTLPGIQVSTEPWTSGELKGYKVKISGKTGAVGGNFRGSVMLTTDVEREKSVEVQFSGIVRSASATPVDGAPGATPATAIPVNPTQTTNAPAAQPK